MLQNYTFIADKRGVRRSFLLFFSLFLLQVTAFAQNDVRHLQLGKTWLEQGSFWT